MPIANEVVSFLCNIAEKKDVTVIETHLSIVVLSGSRAYKIKKAVHLPYADFSSAEQRLQACRNEVTLNRRTAPDLYLAAHRITRTSGHGLTFNGQGELVDAAVEMLRFPDNQVWDAMALRGELTVHMIDTVAYAIADFHQKAGNNPVSDGYERIERVLALNEESNALIETVLEPGLLQGVQSQLRQTARLLSKQLDTRGAEGKIRRCHGDLHLRNICMFNGQPTVFDCIEFNDELANIDVLYDLAFLLMDLWRCGLPHLANRAMNRYLDETQDIEGLCLLPFFMALRASIRAQVLATQAAQDPGTAPPEVASGAGAHRPNHKTTGSTLAQAKDFLRLARDLLQPATPMLVGIGGFSGSGKSTLANALACFTGRAPGARVISSDRIRKKLFSVPATHRLEPQAYTPKVSKKVYDTLILQAQTVLKAGHSVIADAVFGHEPARKRLHDCALELEAPFAGIWLQAPETELVNRVSTRTNDPSDATPEVVQRQLAASTGLLDWTILVSTNATEVLLEQARTVVEAQACNRKTTTRDPCTNSKQNTAI